MTPKVAFGARPPEGEHIALGRPGGNVVAPKVAYGARPLPDMR